MSMAWTLAARRGALRPQEADRSPRPDRSRSRSADRPVKLFKRRDRLDGAQEQRLRPRQARRQLAGLKLFGFGRQGRRDVQLVRGAVEVRRHVGHAGAARRRHRATSIRAPTTSRALHVRELKRRDRVGQARAAGASPTVDFGYNPDEDSWGGTVKLSLPPDPPGAAIRGRIQFADGEMTELGGELTLPSPGIALDPFSVAWLTKIRASMQRPPLRLSGGITIGAGPLMDETTGDRPIVVDGDLTVTLPDSGPSTIEGHGVGSRDGHPARHGLPEVRDQRADQRGRHLKAGFGPFSVDGGIDGWFYKNAFNIRGSVDDVRGDLHRRRRGVLVEWLRRRARTSASPRSARASRGAMTWPWPDQPVLHAAPHRRDAGRAATSATTRRTPRPRRPGRR